MFFAIQLTFLLLFLLFSSSAAASHSYKIGIACDPDYKGESSFAYKLKIAAEKLGHKVTFFNTKCDGKLAVSKKIDFMIATTPLKRLTSDCPNFFCFFHPEEHRFPHVATQYPDADAYLLGFDPSQTPNLARPALQFFPTSSSFRETPSEPKKIFWIQAAWGARCDGEKYLNLFNHLQKQNIIAIYGFATPQLHTLGVIPFNDLSFFETAASYGISLVIHSDRHRKLGIPTGRIFEALACCNITICDRHPFVEEHFGDTLLYIDIEASAQELEMQILKHLDWIKNNPDQAKQMAADAHKIFLEKFQLENQFNTLINFFEGLYRQKP